MLATSRKKQPMTKPLMLEYVTRVMLLPMLKVELVPKVVVKTS
jgi:hypothetical protein